MLFKVLNSSNKEFLPVHLFSYFDPLVPVWEREVILLFLLSPFQLHLLVYWWFKVFSSIYFFLLKLIFIFLFPLMAFSSSVELPNIKYQLVCSLNPSFFYLLGFLCCKKKAVGWSLLVSFLFIFFRYQYPSHSLLTFLTVHQFIYFLLINHSHNPKVNFITYLFGCLLLVYFSSGLISLISWLPFVSLQFKFPWSGFLSSNFHFHILFPGLSIIFI